MPAASPRRAATPRSPRGKPARGVPSPVSVTSTVPSADSPADRSSSPRYAMGRGIASLTKSTSAQSPPHARSPARDAAPSPPASPKARGPTHTAACPSTSHAAGEGLRVQVLSRPARFMIYACDRHRRHLHTGGDGFTVSVRGPSFVYPSLSDHEDGTHPEVDDDENIV